MDPQHPSPPPRPPLPPEQRSALLMERGLALYGRGELEDAVRHWLAACEADPRNARAAGYVAFAAAHDGIDPRLVTFDASALRLDPDPIGPPRANDVPEYIPNPPGVPFDAPPPPLAPAPPGPPGANSAAPRTPPPALHERPAVSEGLLRLRDRLGADDFTGALAVAEALLQLEPQLAEAAEGRRRAEDNLVRMYESRLGSLRAIPTLRMPADEVIWLNLNHREGFILSQIDGVLSYEELLDVCGMPRFEALRVLAQLVHDKVIGAAG